MRWREAVILAALLLLPPGLMLIWPETTPPIAAPPVAGDVVLWREDFAAAVPGDGLPEGWRNYGSRNAYACTRIVDEDGRRSLLLYDQDARVEVGISRTFPVESGKRYAVRVLARRYRNIRPTEIFVQMNLPDGKILGETAILPVGSKAQEFCGSDVIPDGVRSVTVYIMSWYRTKSAVLIDEFSWEQVR